MPPTTGEGTVPVAGGSPIEEEKKAADVEYVDEKQIIQERDEEVLDKTGDVKVAKAIDFDHIGQVFDDVRAIDLDETGKEKPIETEFDVATRLLSLEDDPTLRIFTFRTTLLALGLSCFGAILGQLFYFRPQTIGVSQLFLQIIAFLLGKGLEIIIPGPSPRARLRTADTPFWRYMNHGPFNIKEHVAITIMAATASDSASAISIFAAQDLYYNVKPNAAIGIFTLISSQLIGYGFAGLLRAILVYPTFAVYPSLIPQIQLFDALHRGQEFFLQKKRVKFFWGIFIAIFVWEWFPEYIAPTLTGISIFCLANRKSPWFTRIFGGAAGNEGLGLFSLCLDWNYVGSGGSSIGALFTPLSTQLSLYAGCAVCIVAFCAVYAANTWNSQNFPFLSQLLFYENGTKYDQLRILNDDFTLNNTKLEAEGLPWYAGSQVLFKASRTMYLGAAIMHWIIWHMMDMWNEVLKNRAGKGDDPHFEKMKVYREVPQWWYITMFFLSFALALGTSYGAKSGLPWWALIVMILFAIIFMPIVGTLYAIFGYQPSISIFVQMLAGVLLPGKPVANMYATLYGFNTTGQALALMRDLKMGQYTKIPPRVTFTMQLVGTILGAMLNFLIMTTVIKGNRELLLDIQGSNVWSGQQVQSFNSGAIAWGALGKPLYAPGTRYGWIPWTMIAGLGFPIPFWLLHKWKPTIGFDRVFTPILVAELGYLSVGINSSVFTTFCLAVFSQYYLRKYRARWFRKYNFLLSAALDGGTQVMVFVYSFAVGGASGKAIPMPIWALNPEGNPDYCMRLTR